jgi:C-terminal processing protease CtpA/Prc
LKASFLAVVVLSCLCCEAIADTRANAIALYNAHKYKEAIILFESHYDATFNDASDAYYYALSLTAAGQTGRGVKVCEDIVRRHPTSQSAKLAKIAIVRWQKNILTPELPSELGIVGLKFQIGKQQDFLGKLQEQEQVLINNVFSGGPAAKAFRNGDILLKVDDVPVDGLTKEEIYQLIIGKPNTPVSLTVLRNKETITKTITRMSLSEFSKVQEQIAKEYAQN